MDPYLDFVEMGFGDERAHEGVVVGRVADRQLGGAVHELGDELVEDRLLHEDARRAEADLALETDEVAVRIRVARWFIFKPKILIWVNFGVPLFGKMGIFYGHLEYFVLIWYIFFRVWYHGPRKIWQPWFGLV
jgi:hypothetical protein